MLEPAGANDSSVFDSLISVEGPESSRLTLTMFGQLSTWILITCC